MNHFIEFFEQIINWLFFITHDYGIAIVIITLCVRMLLLPFNIRQRKQMVEQQELSKQVEEIKNRYKNNKEMQEKKLAELYSKNGIGMGSCLTTFIQFPVMICLYNAISQITAFECGTILLPWISSLFVKDPFFILPVATIIIQILPQFYPYLKIFAPLKLQKQTGSMLVSMIIMNSIFIFMIPSGVGIYYFISGLFQSTEQFVYNIICIRKAALQGMCI